MADIAGLLDRQRTALLHGDLRALADIDHALADALDGLPDRDAAALAALARKAAENRTLIEAAMAGVRAARRRTAAVHAAAGGFTAYDSQGKPVPVTR